MIDWGRLAADDFPVPDSVGPALTQLCTMLTSADPTVRDQQAYTILSTWVRRGDLDDHLADLGGDLTAMFGHTQVQARAFAPLVLAAVVDRDSVIGVVDPDRLRGWRDEFVAWWIAEADIRGWDERLGWLHAIAHGADLAGALGSSPRLTGGELADLLTVVARRMTALTDYRYAQMEEDRLARAIVAILMRERLDAASATGWLHVVDELFAGGGPGPLPVPVANTLAVLRAGYVMVDRHDLPHRTVVTDGMAQRLHYAFAAYPLVRKQV
ncbi:hypothetical protein Q0Z83_021670 [Actinoplanes sichuanensis]|uniref:DUF2785 domain-containing protein n=1 Tax=Actinoplanes sichuanensis TaxID=512349 RepID=A0ABW4AIB2_9ACTN|nr:DUF2785 domain-containing protein [Actinoplanes sichuanensis]BEL03976.1 hypothetical protein Q0Z83_021670 [Actinoplanes sichuanensis]